MNQPFPTHFNGVLFDMDGVLFNSMPYHAQAWKQVFTEYGLTIPDDFPYLHEGRTGDGFVQLVYQEQLHRRATPEEVQQIYARKSELFNTYPQPNKIEGIDQVLSLLKTHGIKRTIVTGSGQSSLIERVERYFPHTFSSELLVTAFDVSKGKPDPEPYLKGLAKLGIAPREAIIVENAPMGVKAGVAANVFTVAVNTGILTNEILEEAGADIVFQSMHQLATYLQEKLNLHTSNN